MAVKYLDETGLAYLWAKIKAYVDSHGGSGTPTPTANATSAFDSSAKMNSTDMTSAQVSDFVDSLSGSSVLPADYVVEQGTSGAWTYRKWNSGVSECWAHFGTTSTNNGAWTTNFPTGLFMSGTYPYVIQTPWYGESTDSSRDARAFYLTDGSNSTQFVSYFRTYNGSTYSGNIAMQVHAIGRWK